MTQDWNEFICNRIDTETELYNQTMEAKHRNAIEAQMEDLLTNCLKKSEKELVDEVSFTRGSLQEQDATRLYQQGMLDGVWLLKKLGVLSA